MKTRGLIDRSITLNFDQKNMAKFRAERDKLDKEAQAEKKRQRQEDLKRCTCCPVHRWGRKLK